MLYKDKNRTPKERALDLCQRLTLREKVGQLNQRLYGFDAYQRTDGGYMPSSDFLKEIKKWGGLGTLYGLYRSDPWSGKDEKTGILPSDREKVYNMLQKHVIEGSRFGIPMLLSTECPHGHQALGGYVLPVNLNMGATFNPELVHKAYSYAGCEMKASGVDFALISMLDVARDPRWGRSEECFSEDPYLTSVMADAVVTAVQQENVDVVAKHFCGQGETTGGVNASSARIGRRELYDIHFPPMRRIAPKVAGIMAAYNDIDGIPCHGNPWLLQSVLRDEFDFEGVIMADGLAIDQLGVVTNNPLESAKLAIESGVQISLWDEAFSKLEEAVLGGWVDEDTIDKAVIAVLEVKFKRGLFEQPYLECAPKNSMEVSFGNSDRFQQGVEETLALATESIVLLQNHECCLPLHLENWESIAVIGPRADSIYDQLGDYSPYLMEDKGITIFRGINERFNGEVRYAPGCHDGGIDCELIKEAVETARHSDVIILALGGSSSRFSGATFKANGALDASNAETRMDCGENVDSATLSLPSEQLELLAHLRLLHKPIITVLIQGRAYCIEEILDQSDAVLTAFYPGAQGGKAVASILFGDEEPSGRLPISIPKHVGQLPVAYNHYTSYQAMTYKDIQDGPRFYFGYGLSYTTFVYSDIQWNLEEKTIEFTLKNNGTRDGYAVPQVYVTGAHTGIVPRKALKAFQKVYVKQGETKVIRLTLDEDCFDAYDYGFKKKTAMGPWIVELRESSPIDYAKINPIKND